MSAATPLDVLARRRDLTLSRDVKGLADLYAPDAVIEMPFAGSSESPVRIVGREAIRDFTRQLMQPQSPVRLQSYEITECYRTDDPELVIVELRARLTLVATGRSATVDSIQVLRIRDGRIRLFRDFANPNVHTELLTTMEGVVG